MLSVRPYRTGRAASLVRLAGGVARRPLTRRRKCRPSVGAYTAIGRVSLSAPRERRAQTKPVAPLSDRRPKFLAGWPQVLGQERLHRPSRRRLAEAVLAGRT